MTQVSDFVAIDMGNTLVKIAHFFSNKLIRVEKMEFNTLLNSTDWIQKHASLEGVYSSVRSNLDNEALEKVLPNCKNVSMYSHLPIVNDYKSATLGWDRLLNAVAIHHLKQTENALCIDIGTCIKFDLVEGNHYKGGSISPGLRLRFSSLNMLTANLPYIEDYSPSDLIADTTVESLRSGVINGAYGEIKYFIERYKQLYPSLTIFVTGGDAHHFDIASKNDIFADENLTFIGLYQIYTFNV